MDRLVRHIHPFGPESWCSRTISASPSVSVCVCAELVYVAGGGILADFTACEARHTALELKKSDRSNASIQGSQSLCALRCLFACCIDVFPINDNSPIVPYINLNVSMHEFALRYYYLRLFTPHGEQVDYGGEIVRLHLCHRLLIERIGLFLGHDLHSDQKRLRQFEGNHPVAIDALVRFLSCGVV